MLVLLSLMGSQWGEGWGVWGGFGVHGQTHVPPSAKKSANGNTSAEPVDVSLGVSLCVFTRAKRVCVCVCVCVCVHVRVRKSTVAVWSCMCVETNSSIIYFISNNY